jgi:hypothetical protein
MMRTIEILLVIVIITGAFIIASFFAVLPSPRQVSPMSLERLALTTLQQLDVSHDLSTTIFRPTSDPSWTDLQIALSASLPSNMVYNLTVYDVVPGSNQLYQLDNSISNAESLGVSTGSTSYLVASSNVTFSFTPEKVGEHGSGGTLYILNCSDASGWWITGYTAQKLAEDLYGMLSPYFQTTIMVQNTTQFAQILDNVTISNSPYENISDAVVINTAGEAIPIPSEYAQNLPPPQDYAKFCFMLGQKVRTYNWTFASNTVGYPLYYVTNNGWFSTHPGTPAWGISGLQSIGPAGLNSFLEGLDNQPYVPNGTWITGSPGSVHLSSEAIYTCNYYGIYPSYYQTASRALPSSITATYDLNVANYIFNPSGGYIAGAVYRQATSGVFLALGLTRTPDIRLTALGLLDYYKPRLYRSDYTSTGTSKLVVLQLGPMGGI